MKIAHYALALLTVSGASILFAQTPSPSTEPLIADVHPSPYRKTINYSRNISPQRFDLRHATIFNMIEFAYALGEQDDDRENAAILGGPTWIDFDRFDITAKLPPLRPGPAKYPDETIRPILKRVLAERFHLVFHLQDRPLPGFIVTVAKDGPRLTEAKDPTAADECHDARDTAHPEQYTLTCTSQTMARFAANLGEDFPHPLADRTGLTKRYDITLKLVLGPDVHTREDLARIYTDAFPRQLGLVVTRGDVPRPAFVVDQVDRTPTPNPPEIATLIPPLPDLEFEVASIRPAADEEPQSQIRPNGSQIAFSSMPLSELIARAWQLPTARMLGDALPLLPRQRFTILVKLPPGVDADAVYQDADQIASMLRKLVIDRFQVKYRWGEWTQPDAWVLLAGTPKMKVADPNSRSFCKYGPAEGEKAARGAGSPYDGEFHCQNVTMAQFADMVQPLAQFDVKNRVPDKTGLAGAYDFTLFYTSGRKLRLDTAAAADAARQAGDATPAPVAGVGLQDGFRKQLGLKLEKQPLTVPALVLDHFEPAPTAN